MVEALLFRVRADIIPPQRPQRGTRSSRSRLPARVVTGTFPSPAHAEGHWLAASGAIKISCVID
jgi:hypothetical protein